MVRWLISIGLLLTAQSLQAQMLQISFSQHPQQSQAKSYSTTTTSPLPSMSVEAGQTVTLQQRSERGYDVQSVSWYWVDLQKVPVTETAISLTPELTNKGVVLKVQYFVREERGTASEMTSYQSVVSGEPGQWISLIGHDATHKKANLVSYQSGSRENHLAVKVERLN